MPTIPRWTERLFPYPKVYLGALGATIVWHLALLVGASRWNPGAIVVLSLIPAAFLVIWAVLSPIGLWLRTGLGDPETVPLRKSLVLSHLGATVVQLILFAAVWLLGGLWVFRAGVGVPNLLDYLPIPVIDWFAWIVVRAVLISLVALTLLAAVTQCAFLISRLSEGWRTFLFIWGGLMLTWGSLRALPGLAEWLAWLPKLSIQEFVSVGDGFELRTSYYESGPYAAAFILVALLLFASRWLLGVITAPALPANHESPEAQGAADGGTPRRILQLNERVLIVFAALSLVFVYDVFTNNRTVREGFQHSLVRPVVAYQDDLGFTRGVPFVSSQGRIDLPSTGITTLYIKAPGDIRLHAANSDSIAIDYTLRTFAESAKAAQAYHELVDVVTLQAGGTLEVILRTPPAQKGIGARVRYDVALPRGVHAMIEVQDGLIEAHGLADGLTAQLTRSSLRATEVQGSVAIESVDGDVWLTSVDGDVTVTHHNGRVEVHGVKGNLEIYGDHGTFESSDVHGSVEAHITRSLGRFARVGGDLTVDGLMARIQVDDVKGAVGVKGVLSPIALSNPLATVTLQSDRGNVTVDLDANVDWRLQLASERGSIYTTLPDEFTTSREVQRGNQRVTAIKGGGGTIFQGEIRHADLSVGAVSR